MENHTIQRMALIMIALVVLLPVYAAESYAASITVVATGRDEIPHFRAMDDEIRIEVTANWPGREHIGPANLRVIDGNAIEFNCNPTDTATGEFLCVYNYPAYPTRDPSVRFSLQLFEDGGQAASSPTTETLMVDYNPPTGSFSVGVEEFGSGSKFVAKYDVSDTACDAGQCSGLCAGIGKVSFEIGGSQVGIVDFNETTCSASGSANLSLSLGSVSSKTLCMVMTDQVAQKSEECDEVVLDGAQPMVTSIAVLNPRGTIIKYTNGQPLSGATIQVNVTEDSGIRNITINAQSLDEREGSTLLTAVNLTCTGGPPEYVCTAPFFMYVGEAKTAQLSVVSEDVYGNKGAATITMPVLVDSAKPVIDRLYSRLMFNNINFFREENNTIMADILETQSGMSMQNLVLDMSSIGAQCIRSEGGTTSNCLPNKCYTSGIGWTCEWSYFTLDDKESGNILTAVVTKGYDDAGNEISDSASAAFHVDKDPPNLFYMNITPISQEYGAELGVVRTGDAIEIKAYIAERTDVYVVANFTEILGEGDFPIIDGECAEFESQDPDYREFIEANATSQGIDVNRDKIFECNWFVGPVTGINGLDYPIGFTMVDIFDQQSEDELDVKIYSVLDEFVENYWNINMGRCEWYGVNTAEGYDYGVDYSAGALVAVPGVAEDNLERATYDSDGTVNFLKCDMLSPKTGLDRLIWHLRSQALWHQFNITSPYNPTDEGDTGRAEMLYFEWYCGDVGTEYINTDPESNLPAIYMMEYDDSDFSKRDVFYMLTNPNTIHEPSYMIDNTTKVIQHFFNINCTAGIITLDHEKNAVTPLEQHNFTMTIPVYNNPLGMPLDNVRQLINQTQEGGLIKNDWITTIKQLFGYAEVICNTISALITIVTSLAGIKDIFTGCADTVAGATACSNPANNMGQVQSQTTDLAGDMIGDLYAVFCGMFIQCRPTDPEQFKDADGNCDDAFCQFATAWAFLNNWYTNLVGGFFEIKFQASGEYSPFSTGTASGAAGKSELEAGETAYQASLDRGEGRDAAQRERQAEVRRQTTGVEDTGARWFPDSIFSKESFDTKQSMITSAFTACLPGVFYNLEKLRQIECTYLMCLKVEAANGRPIWQCDAEKGYQTCEFWTGQILNAIPLVQYFAQLSGALKGIIDDPISAIGMVFPDMLCKVICESTFTLGCSGCRLYQFATAIVSTAIGTYKSFENWKYIGVDVCKEALKENPDPSAIWPD